jgi:hypothetical protein
MVLLEQSLWITSKISSNGMKLLKETKTVKMIRMVSLHLVCKSDCNTVKTKFFVSVLNSPQGGKMKEKRNTCAILALSTIEIANCETTNGKSVKVPLTTNELNRRKEEMDIEVRAGDIDGDCTDQESMFSISVSPFHQSPLNSVNKEY